MNHTKCESCDSCTINGVYVHEYGCPDSWKTEVRECGWCGSKFKPEMSEQSFCDDECARSYFG